ncbi:MAG: excinuclease ABC subunit UvrC, partial [Spirochaetales bacterium]
MSEHQTVTQHIRESLRYFPTKPGVYIMKDATGTIIYVGKARSLRSRVKSYFSGQKDPKTTVLVSHVADIDHIVCRNEYEALLLENSLIKKHQPRYNINLKDGKTYPVIRITNEKYPRVFRTRNVVRDGSTYYGPYTNVANIDRYLELIEQLFPLRKCRGAVKPRPAPCLYYHIGRCTAVCAGKTSHEQYMAHIERIKKLLSGERESLIADLTEQMHEAGANLDFEKAARIRDTISAIEDLAYEQQVIDHDPDVRDYVGFARRDQMASFVVFQMRGGSLIGSDMFRTEVFADEEEDLLQFLTQYYSQVRNPPTRLFLPLAVDTAALAAFFRDELSREVSVHSIGELPEVDVSSAAGRGAEAGAGS